MPFGTSLLILIGVSILVFTIWNLLSLRNLKKHSHKSHELNDAKYYELKYKNEFLLALVSVITAAAAIFGYNSIQSVENSVKEDFKSKIDTLNISIAKISHKSDSLDNSIRLKADSISQYINLLSKNVEKDENKVKSTASYYNQILSFLDKKQNDLDSQHKVSYVNMQRLSDKIAELNNKNILKQEFYIVDSLAVDIKNNRFDSIFYFRNLSTTFGDRLPKFTAPPLILSISNEGALVQITKVTTESFESIVSSFIDYGNKYTYFKILISEAH